MQLANTLYLDSSVVFISSTIANQFADQSIEPE
jgi:hypothetical protein